MRGQLVSGGYPLFDFESNGDIHNDDCKNWYRYYEKITKQKVVDDEYDKRKIEGAKKNSGSNLSQS